jgi:hypothetical protein
VSSYEKLQIKKKNQGKVSRRENCYSSREKETQLCELQEMRFKAEQTEDERQETEELAEDQEKAAKTLSRIMLEVHEEPL